MKASKASLKRDPVYYAKNMKIKRPKNYCTYLMSNQRNTVFYTGISGNLPNRDKQHETKKENGFTKKYNVDKLVYFECFDNPTDAINREKEIKGWRREKKINLIKTINPNFNDLSLIWERFWKTGVLVIPRDSSSFLSSE